MRLIAALAVVLSLAAPAAAETFELFPTNKRAADGSFRPVLDIWRDRREVLELRAERGDIPPRTVLDANAAIAFVVARFGLTPGRDRVFYCPIGQPGVGCQNPTDPDDWVLYRIVRWP